MDKCAGLRKISDSSGRCGRSPRLLHVYIQWPKSAPQGYKVQWGHSKYRGWTLHAERSPSNNQPKRAKEEKEEPARCWPEGRQAAQGNKRMQSKACSQPQGSVPGAQQARAVSLSRLSMWPTESGTALQNMLTMALPSSSHACPVNSRCLHRGSN